jgi:soluble lytic murein transglycosylase-like protein
MRNLRGTYVHRGDAIRRMARIRRGLLLGGFALAVVLGWQNAGTEEAAAEPQRQAFPSLSVNERVQEELDKTRGELDLANAQLARWNKVFSYSSQYRIGADLAADILDIALAEGIEPELAFRLVRVESQFNERATSPVGAVGLTQLMPATAKYFEPGVTKAKLYDRKTNLRVGFRYLRTLIKEQKGNVKMALLVYNRGPVAVQAARANGINPSNGYDKVVTKGYSGSGVVD